MSVGQKIVEILLQRGLSKKDIQRHCGCDYKSIFAWERGWYKPSLENLHKLRVLYIKTTKDHFGQMELPLNYEEYAS
jgi:DNA-binding XRE family transcriptional regulator